MREAVYKLSLSTFLQEIHIKVALSGVNLKEPVRTVFALAPCVKDTNYLCCKEARDVSYLESHAAIRGNEVH